MGGSFAGRLFTVIGTLIIFAVICYLAYITTKLIGTRFSSGNQGTKNMKVIESLPLGQDRMLLIVKAGEKTILIGSSKDHMEYLCDLDESQLDLSGQPQTENGDFSVIFRKVLSEKFSSFRPGGKNNEKK